MLKFIKEYSYDIFKLFLNQIAMAVFGLVMSVATQQTDYLFLAVGVFGVVLYLVITYISARSVGERESAAVLSGRRAATPWRGVWIGICANIVNIVCGVLIFVCAFYLVQQPISSVYDADGNKAEIYLMDPDTKELARLDTVYSDKGDDIYAYDNGKSEITLRTHNGDGAATLDVYDKDGNELKLYGRGLNANVTRGYVESAATGPYSVAFLICTFLQSFFVPMREMMFGGVSWFHLITPIFPIVASGLGYYLASKKKRLFAFIPESKTPKRYRF